VNVAAGATVHVPLTVTTDLFAAVNDYGFLVTASAASVAQASVEGELVLEGTPPTLDVNAHGVVVALNSTTATVGQGTAAHFLARGTNTGSATETYHLSISGLQVG